MPSNEWNIAYVETIGKWTAFHVPSGKYANNPSDGTVVFLTEDAARQAAHDADNDG